MNRYLVTWSKTYYAHGEEVVTAKSEVDAQEIIEDKIGDLEGSMQYDPNENYVEAFELKES